MERYGPDYSYKGKEEMTGIQNGPIVGDEGILLLNIVMDLSFQSI